MRKPKLKYPKIDEVNILKLIPTLKVPSEGWYPTLDEFYDIIGDESVENLPFMLWLLIIPHSLDEGDVETFEEVKAIVKDEHPNIDVDKFISDYAEE